MKRGQASCSRLDLPAEAHFKVYEQGNPAGRAIKQAQAGCQSPPSPGSRTSGERALAKENKSIAT